MTASFRAYARVTGKCARCCHLSLFRVGRVGGTSLRLVKTSPGLFQNSPGLVEICLGLVSVHPICRKVTGDSKKCDCSGGVV